MNWGIYEKRKRLIICALIVNVVVVGTTVIAPLMTLPSNCGGNSAALSYCNSNYMNIEFFFIMEEHFENIDKNRFNIDQIPNSVLAELNAQSHWTGNANYFIRNKNITLNADNEEIFVFCDTPYNNVPQKRWGSSPFTYAAVKSNGEKVLLSINKYKNLDKTQFIKIKDLLLSIKDKK